MCSTQRLAGASQMVGAGLRGPVAELLAGEDQAPAECQKLLQTLQSRCPGLLPGKPLPPGTVGPELHLTPAQLQHLVIAAAPAAAGAAVGTRPEILVWSHGGSELMVILTRVAVRVTSGMIVVTIPISCDQAHDATIQVGFAVGDDLRPAGMLAVTEDRPRGPAVVVDIWGEALTAFAWQVLLAVTVGLAAASGADTGGAPLVPAALTASAGQVSVLTMARHAFGQVSG